MLKLHVSEPVVGEPGIEIYFITYTIQMFAVHQGYLSKSRRYRFVWNDLACLYDTFRFRLFGFARVFQRSLQLILSFFMNSIYIFKITYF